ncbi:MAG: F0F1 ATP synthase subunit B [Rhodospirillaceae bacterium]
MLKDATFWVAISFVIFAVVAYKFVWAQLMGTLDQRGIRIKQELDEAQRLREDAERVMADCKKRQGQIETDANNILVYAREEAARIRQQAEIDVQAAVKRREAQAIERIAQAEAQALAEVRSVAVDLAMAATRRLFEDRVASGAPDPLVDSSIKGLGALLN